MNKLTDLHGRAPLCKSLMVLCDNDNVAHTKVVQCLIGTDIIRKDEGYLRTAWDYIVVQLKRLFSAGRDLIAAISWRVIVETGHIPGYIDEFIALLGDMAVAVGTRLIKLSRRVAGYLTRFWEFVTSLWPSGTAPPVIADMRDEATHFNWLSDSIATSYRRVTRVLSEWILSFVKMVAERAKFAAGMMCNIMHSVTESMVLVEDAVFLSCREMAKKQGLFLLHVVLDSLSLKGHTPGTLKTYLYRLSKQFAENQKGILQSIQIAKPNVSALLRDSWWYNSIYRGVFDGITDITGWILKHASWVFSMLQQLETLGYYWVLTLAMTPILLGKLLATYFHDSIVDTASETTKNQGDLNSKIWAGTILADNEQVPMANREALRNVLRSVNNIMKEMRTFKAEEMKKKSTMSEDSAMRELNMVVEVMTNDALDASVANDLFIAKTGVGMWTLGNIVTQCTELLNVEITRAVDAMFLSKDEQHEFLQKTLGRNRPPNIEGRYSTEQLSKMTPTDREKALKEMVEDELAIKKGLEQEAILKKAQADNAARQQELLHATELQSIEAIRRESANKHLQKLRTQMILKEEESRTPIRQRRMEHEQTVIELKEAIADLVAFQARFNPDVAARREEIREIEYNQAAFQRYTQQRKLDAKLLIEVSDLGVNPDDPRTLIRVYSNAALSPAIDATMLAKLTFETRLFVAYENNQRAVKLLNERQSEIHYTNAFARTVLPTNPRNWKIAATMLGYGAPAALLYYYGTQMVILSAKMTDLNGVEINIIGEEPAWMGWLYTLWPQGVPPWLKVSSFGEYIRTLMGGIGGDSFIGKALSHFGGPVYAIIPLMSMLLQLSSLASILFHGYSAIAFLLIAILFGAIDIISGERIFSDALIHYGLLVKDKVIYATQMIAFKFITTWFNPHIVAAGTTMGWAGKIADGLPGLIAGGIGFLGNPLTLLSSAANYMKGQVEGLKINAIEPEYGVVSNILLPNINTLVPIPTNERGIRSTSSLLAGNRSLTLSEMLKIYHDELSTKRIADSAKSLERISQAQAAREKGEYEAKILYLQQEVAKQKGTLQIVYNRGGGGGGPDNVQEPEEEDPQLG
jgi:hypothetical protein